MIRGNRNAFFDIARHKGYWFKKYSLKGMIFKRMASIRECGPVSFNGSMSLEASLVVPLFFCFMMTILLTLEMVRLQTNVFEALHQSLSHIYTSGISGMASNDVNDYLSKKEYPYIVLKNGASGIKISDESSTETDGLIYIKALYEMKSFIYYMPLHNLAVEDEVHGHSFTGYVPLSQAGFDKEPDEYVYITRTGVKYHRSTECTYIHIVPNVIDYGELGSKRNIDGGKYYPCELCNPPRGGIIYITDYGARYHSTNTCIALKKDIKTILLKEAVASGYTPCSKCG